MTCRKHKSQSAGGWLSLDQERARARVLSRARRIVLMQRCEEIHGITMRLAERPEGVTAAAVAARVGVSVEVGKLAIRAFVNAGWIKHNSRLRAYRPATRPGWEEGASAGDNERVN